MKVILNYDASTGQITDASGMPIIAWPGLNYEELPESSSGGSGQVDGEQLIRLMKIAAHIEDPDKVTSL